MSRYGGFSMNNRYRQFSMDARNKSVMLAKVLGNWGKIETFLAKVVKLLLNMEIVEFVLCKIINEYTFITFIKPENTIKCEKKVENLRFPKLFVYVLLRPSGIFSLKKLGIKTKKPEKIRAVFPSSNHSK